MRNSSQVSVIRKLYDAKGDPAVINSVLAPDVQWDVTEGFPHGGIYNGLASTLNDFFGPLYTDFAEFGATGDEFFEDGDHVIALGHYSGLTKTGKRVTARFAHFWTLRDGKIVRLQQTADTVPLARALAD